MVKQTLIGIMLLIVLIVTKENIPYGHSSGIFKGIPDPTHKCHYWHEEYGPDVTGKGSNKCSYHSDQTRYRKAEPDEQLGTDVFPVHNDIC